MVGESVKTRARSSEVIRSWSNVLVAATLGDVDVLGLCVEFRHWLKDGCCSTCTTLTALQLHQSRGFFSALQELEIMTSSVQDGSWPSAGKGRRGDQS